MAEISPESTTARERARRPDGQFGQQASAEPDLMALPGAKTWTVATPPEFANGAEAARFLTRAPVPDSLIDGFVREWDELIGYIYRNTIAKRVDAGLASWDAEHPKPRLISGKWAADREAEKERLTAQADAWIRARFDLEIVPADRRVVVRAAALDKAAHEFRQSGREDDAKWIETHARFRPTWSRTADVSLETIRNRYNFQHFARDYILDYDALAVTQAREAAQQNLTTTQQALHEIMTRLAKMEKDVAWIKESTDETEKASLRTERMVGAQDIREDLGVLFGKR